ncbi:type I secretion system permease/ATPase [Roseomonas sp. GC11]|uniref:type I secretion system permease/ATPase n=1 Tax=Roseomonas sp. GC11 TaxID=2950546 RepID=UPI00210DC08D|nr:type I secretion system permease/ATPase [Roseomonas sp. GC11]MCQ4160509.1 type I secretion system permease/ATPase [Roseomonas sp. GC11]
MVPTVTALALISGVVNVLALTSPLFMLQVYDRVLTSHSLPTLAALALLALGLFAVQAALDILRARILLRLGELFDRRLSARVHAAVLRLPLRARMAGDGLQPLRDLDNIRGFLSGQGPTAFFDLPWMPLYLALCFLFHPLLGLAALAGALLLVSLTLLAHLLSRAPARATIEHNMTRNALMEAGRRNAEVVQALGMGRRFGLRWQAANDAYLAANRRAGDVAGGLGGASKALRVVLQSAILAIGAYLVIRQEASSGVMIAASVMMGRAMAPVDLAIANWKPFLLARQSRARLRELFAAMPEAAVPLALPRPERGLRAEALTIRPPGAPKPTVTGISFALEAGSALGIIGPSGSGKSSLARALAGAWEPAAGSLRLDGATFAQWEREALGRHLGYLPQGVELFDGTIAENIARFEPGATPEAIVAAARAAGAHGLILALEAGYDTRIGEVGGTLSAGQRQRIGLARALYGEPFLVVLDEPNANLDAEGERALIAAIAAIRARRGIAIVVAHRPSAIAAVDQLLMMEAGRMKAFGPREAVLAQVLKPGALRVVAAGQGEHADA